MRPEPESGAATTAERPREGGFLSNVIPPVPEPSGTDTAVTDPRHVALPRTVRLPSDGASAITTPSSDGGDDVRRIVQDLRRAYVPNEA